MSDFADLADAQEFSEALRKLSSEKMAEDAFRQVALTLGVYPQRQSGAFMIRVKVPQGILTASQLECLGGVADEFSRGLGQATTRQDIQFHFVSMPRIEEALTYLAERGLTTRDACGNRVRNVTACSRSGLCEHEAFSVLPYGRVISSFFLRNPRYQGLPRKFKIALSGCLKDCALGAINDVGLISRAVQREGRAVKGFRVLVAGGLGVTPERGGVLEEFVEEGKILSVCEALVCMFDRLGDRGHKRRARMKFIMRKLGMEKFREEYERELKDVCRNGGVEGVEVSLEEERGPSADRPNDHGEVADDDFDRWRKTNVVPQKQTGFVAVKVRLPRGDVTGEQFRSLASLVSDCGWGTLRTVIDQNLLVPWIPEGNIYRAYERLAAMGLNQANAGLISDVISCPGAETCRKGVVASRDLASCLAGYLENDPDASALAEEASEIRIKVSGCPNSCGQHHVGDIGLHGGVTHVKGKRVPVYHFLLGGRVDERGAFFGRDFGRIPVRRISEAMKRILEFYVKERREKERASEYLRRIDEKMVAATLSDLTDIREENLEEGDFRDLAPCLL